MENYIVSSIKEYNELKKKGLIHSRKTTITFYCKKCNTLSHKQIKYLSYEPSFLCEKCKREETCLTKFGSKNPFLSKKIQKKAHETVSKHCKERRLEQEKENQIKKEKRRKEKEEKIIKEFGSIENFHKYNSLKTYKEKVRFREIIKYGSHEKAQEIRVQKIKNTKYKKYGDPNYSNSDLRKQHNLEKYGVEYYFQSEDAITKIKNTKIKKYGYSDYNNREKAGKTNLKRYGYTSPRKNELVKQKTVKTSLERYGVVNGGGSMQAMQKMHSKYTYQNRNFDSSDELALYIYLIDNKIDFEYKPKIFFEYEFNLKKHRYYPDFKINGELVEVKGSHFFDLNGRMRCPFKKKEWDDKIKQSIDDFYESKYQCMIHHNVKILKSEDTEKYLNYVKVKYGKDYLKQFRNKKV